jgi:hypothetical protein
MPRALWPQQTALYRLRAVYTSKIIIPISQCCANQYSILVLAYQSVIIIPTAYMALPSPQYPFHLLVLGNELLDRLDVLLLGIGRAQALVLSPLVVLRLAL